MKISQIIEKSRKKNEELTGIVKIIRTISYYLTPPFIFLRIKANNITYLMIFTGIISSLLMLLGQPLYYALAFLFMLIHIELDFIDGNVARYFNQTSKKGVFLDSIGHLITNMLIWSCAGIGLFLLNENLIYIIIGFTIPLIQFGIHVLREEKNKLIESKATKTTKANSLVKEIYIFVFDYRLIWITFISLIGFLKEALIFFFVVTVIEGILKLRNLMKFH